MILAALTLRSVLHSLVVLLLLLLLRVSGNLVVSMRPMTPTNAVRATELTARYPRVHGSPVHIGDPVSSSAPSESSDRGLIIIHVFVQASIGIADVLRPDYGEAVTIREGEVPVFWACGVTPQAVVMSSR